MTDPITDMFIRVKNAAAVGKPTVSVPFSKVKQEIAEVLKRESLIEEFTKKGKGVAKRLELVLRYKDETPAFSDFIRRSRPGQRQYRGHRKLFPIKGGYGIGILSTPRGIMSDKEARKQKVGGEIMVEVW